MATEPKSSPTGEWHVILVHKTLGTKTIRLHGGLLEPQATAAAFRKVSKFGRIDPGWTIRSCQKLKLPKLSASPAQRQGTFERTVDQCLCSS